MSNEIKFSDLKIGDKFFVWGDQMINYNYPVWCKCIKVSETIGEEIDGVRFGINKESTVYIELKEN